MDKWDEIVHREKNRWLLKNKDIFELASNLKLKYINKEDGIIEFEIQNQKYKFQRLGKKSWTQPSTLFIRYGSTPRELYPYFEQLLDR